jgi:SAM-dependent methyltransferase
MDRQVFDLMQQTDESHWWFVARRNVLRSLVQRKLQLPDHARILDAGAGTGANLKMLQEFGEVSAFEHDDAARDFATRRSGLAVAAGTLPDFVPFEGQKFDLITLLDVLEHLEDDVAALQSLNELIRNDGAILMTVPAIPWLWSNHDLLHHHKRRYAKAALLAAIARAGLKCTDAGYFNSVLLPLAVGQRLISKAVGRDRELDAQPPRLLNRALEKAFSAERGLMKFGKFPIGLSLYAIAVRN